MASYKVRFSLGGGVYEMTIGAASSGSAMQYVQIAHPQATGITVVG